MGTLMTGLTVGILLSRTVSGFIAGIFGAKLAGRLVGGLGTRRIIAAAVLIG